MKLFTLSDACVWLSFSTVSMLKFDATVLNSDSSNGQQYFKSIRCTLMLSNSGTNVAANNCADVSATAQRIRPDKSVHLN